MPTKSLHKRTFGSITKPLAAALLLAACGAPEADDGSRPETAPLRLGAQLYAQHCALCHGPRLQAQPGMVDLRLYRGSARNFRVIVTNGRGTMPVFSGVFSQGELEALYAFVREHRRQGDR